MVADRSDCALCASMGNKVKNMIRIVIFESIISNSSFDSHQLFFFIKTLEPSPFFGNNNPCAVYKIVPIRDMTKHQRSNTHIRHFSYSNS
jgi:nitrogenase molybdenum-iron protein alpha/beta subunit